MKAGHSKWANIKHRKARQDAKRGKIFTRLIREITISARLGGSDRDANPRLRAAIQAALAANMTKDTIERAIKRGAGDEDGSSLEEIRYEGYGPNGVAILVDAMTDNRNRTVAEVRHAFTKHGGNLGTSGSVAYLFAQQGIVSFGPGADEEKIMEVAIEAGAEDVVVNEDQSIDVICAPEVFADVDQAMREGGLVPDNAEVSMVPSIEVALDKDSAEKMLKLLDVLEDLDDTQNVYSNADLSALEGE